jgi:two-component system CheB/CheR fusion protein
VADFADGVATVRSAFTRAGAVEAAATTLKVSDYLNEELQAAARDGRTVVIRDMRTDPRVDARRYEALGVRAGVIVPFRREGEWRHSFAVGTPEARDWREDEIQLLQDVASRFFPRIERARAVEALRQSHEELRAARARLEEADRRKDHFLAVLSHELRNPLSPVKNSLYVLDRVPPGGDQDRRARQVIARQIDLLAHLVDDLLDVTRITRGKVQLQRGRLELNELVRRTVEDHRGVFERAGVEVRLVSAPAEVLIDADRNRVSQIVSNLLQNAAKFTPREGRVTLTVAAEAPSRRAVVRVADTGAGMSREVLAHLFEPFMQADPTLDRSKGGLGLGLALVKGMVELHGGTVEAHSDGMGRGSTFTVRLPLDPSPPSARVGDHPRSPGVPRRVLVIEDNVDAAESLRDLLTLVGHEVAIAGNGPEGIARARAFRPQVVLCDIGLPGMDGYEVARAFRADAALRHAHLVALSGYALPEDLHRAAQAGFERHLAKPPSLEKLEGVLGATSAE